MARCSGPVTFYRPGTCSSARFLPASTSPRAVCPTGTRILRGSSRQASLPTISPRTNRWLIRQTPATRWTDPLFVRAGSIMPLGTAVLSAQQVQPIASMRVYPGADADFALFSDDGTTYSYENGGGSITRFHWDEASHRLTHEGAAWSKSAVTVVGVTHP